MVDKLILLDKIERDMHMKIDSKLLPKPKVISYLDEIKSNIKHHRLLTRYKIYKDE